MKCTLILAALFATLVAAQMDPEGWYGDSLGYPDGDYADGLDDGVHELQDAPYGAYGSGYPQGVDDAEDYDGVDGYLDDDGDNVGTLARRWVVPVDYPMSLVRRAVLEPRGVSPTIFANAAKLKKNKLKKQKFNFVNKKAKKINRKHKTVFIG
ncbi:hypothetical protein H4R35_000124 [Dimargaris xerosporica]|nr:hypothetical protein H4R35_000124 [Dimargaris xerosporica]